MWPVESKETEFSGGTGTMRRVTTLAAIFFAIVVSSPALAQSSDFDDLTLQGWSKEPPFNGELFVDSNGNPGGAMVATDTVAGGGGLLALAPTGYTGDISSFEGIQWDEFVPDHGDATVIATSIMIRSTGGSEYVSGNALGPIDSWHTKVEPFVPEAWTLTVGSESLDDVLQSVESLVISMDTSQLADGSVESRVDNVELFGAPPVPTVSEWGLIILTLLLLMVGTIVSFSWAQSSPSGGAARPSDTPTAIP